MHGVKGSWADPRDSSCGSFLHWGMDPVYRGYIGIIRVMLGLCRVIQGLYRDYIISVVVASNVDP